NFLHAAASLAFSSFQQKVLIADIVRSSWGDRRIGWVGMVLASRFDASSVGVTSGSRPVPDHVDPQATIDRPIPTAPPGVRTDLYVASGTAPLGATAV